MATLEMSERKPRMILPKRSGTRQKDLPGTTKMKQKKERLRRLVKAANSVANPLDLISESEPWSFVYGKEGGEVWTCSVHHYKAKDLPPDLVSWFMDLMAKNMKPLYEKSSWGWNEAEKRREMTHGAAQYLIVTREDTQKPIAFSHFRFDMDHGRPVLYCYEVQVEPEAQSMKLGSRIVSLLESMAVAVSIRRVVLTALLHNPRSVTFFRSLGYDDDETNLDGPRDYLILSKRVTKTEQD